MHVLALNSFDGLQRFVIIVLHQKSLIIRLVSSRLVSAYPQRHHNYVWSCLSGFQTELLDLFVNGSYNTGVTHEKLKEFFTDRMLFEHISGQSSTVLFVLNLIYVAGFVSASRIKPTFCSFDTLCFWICSPMLKIIPSVHIGGVSHTCLYARKQLPVESH